MNNLTPSWAALYLTAAPLGRIGASDRDVTHTSPSVAPGHCRIPDDHPKGLGPHEVSLAFVVRHFTSILSSAKSQASSRRRAVPIL